MATTYQSILWNRQKKLYDIFILVCIAIYFISFIVFSGIFNPEITLETLIIRSTGTLSLLMLHVILSIGPLSRLNKNFLPLLYNRRHLGVSFFIIAAVHGSFNIIQFHTGGISNPIASIFLENRNYSSFLDFPFQVLGVFALMIFFLMAVTSHDFWLKNLGPAFWKAMHMFVYLAYVLVILHVILGVVQAEKSILLVYLLGAGMISIILLHLVAGKREYSSSHRKNKFKDGEWVLVGKLSDIPNTLAKIVKVGPENIAVFKYDNKISAVSNVCKHQNGPLGEGRIIDGCITCPWHGYQYYPHNGCSPPPFTEKINTYKTMIEKDEVWVNRKGQPEGTEIEPTIISGR